MNLEDLYKSASHDSHAAGLQAVYQQGRADEAASAAALAQAASDTATAQTLTSQAASEDATLAAQVQGTGDNTTAGQQA